MKEKLIIIFKAVIILGTIGIALNILFGENTMIYVERGLVENTTLSWYRFHIKDYYDQLETAITDTTTLQLDLPARQWRDIAGVDAWQDLGWDISVLINYIVLIINVLLYPLKIGGYMMRFILAILGLNFRDTNSGIYWLGKLANGLMSISINYIGGSLQ